MSHVYSTYQDPSSQRLTPEEARELIERLERRRVADGTVSVQEVADALGIPVHHVQDVVRQMRLGETALKVSPKPVPASTWLKNRLWIWMLAAMAAVFVAMQFYVAWMNRNIAARNAAEVYEGEFSRNFTEPGPRAEFPYDSDMLSEGSRIGLKAPGGFSYYISATGEEAAVMGDQSDFERVARLSPKEIEKLQNKLADDLVNGFDRLATRHPQILEDSPLDLEIEANYFPGGDPVTIELEAPRGVFPVSSGTAAGKAFRETVLHEVKVHWEEITAESP